jgi:hypothetical protein
MAMGRTLETETDAATDQARSRLLMPVVNGALSAENEADDFMQGRLRAGEDSDNEKQFETYFS